MRKILIVILALTAITSSANAQSLSVKDIEVQLGQLTEMEVTIEGAAGMTALQFNLQLPKGLTAQIVGIANGVAANGHTLSVHKLDGGEQLFILYSMDLESFGEGELLRIPVKAGYEEMTATGRLHTVRTATAEAVSLQADETFFSVSVKANTGISRTDAITNMSENIYTIDGRHLSDKPTRNGVYIVNKKKVLVK